MLVNHRAGEYSTDENIPGAGTVQVHTNGLEGVWTQLRTRLQYRTRRTIARVDLYLDELMYRRINRPLFAPLKY